MRQPAAPKRRVLVVDDDPSGRVLLAKMVGFSGHLTEMAESGPVALQMIRDTAFDLVLLDLIMPGMSGLEVLETIRAKLSEIELPVIIVTAHPDIKELIRCMDHGANDCISRPFNTRLALARIEVQLRIKALAMDQAGGLHAIQGTPRSIPPSLSHYCDRCGTALFIDDEICYNCNKLPAGGQWPLINESDWPDLGRTLAGRYFIEQPIGQGSVGRVYRALDLDLKRDFAVKIATFATDTEGNTRDLGLARQQMLTEVQALAQLDNPHIVKISHVLQHGSGGWAMVMDFCQGESLFDVLERNERIEPMLALDIVSQITSALQEAHDIGILHRDIKPANIMLERLPNGSIFARLLDFGIAQTIDNAAPDSNHISGTPEYLSPEVILGEKQADARSDIYALGITLSHMLTGAAPFTHSKVTDVLMAQLYHEIPPLPDDLTSTSMVRMLNGLLGRMTAKEPEQRFQTVGALQSAIAVARLLDDFSDFSV